VYELNGKLAPMRVDTPGEELDTDLKENGADEALRRPPRTAR
jgi:hypothetical protein